MSLAAGTRLGPYEIQAAIGAGGMGEVYRARDTQLKRDVALKVLPAEVAADPERLARFRREAELLAALNHPHIAQIHGLVDEAAVTGTASRGVLALVMELVEGPTLAERIARGPVPLDEALALATQFADALEYAHERGIIHRDLKPANIKLAADGAVKVLDFGLAKALAPPGEAPGSHQDPTNSPTMTSPAAMTRMGIILGTAAYMSPEQARGAAVDKRADIWAFGAVLFEMLTGRPCFAGDTVTDVLAAVVKSEPEWAALPAGTPPRVRELLRRCLAKDRKQRLHDIGDARLDLVDAHPSPSTAFGEPLQPRRVSPGRRLVVAGGLLALLACLVALAMWQGQKWLQPRTAAPVIRLSLDLPAGQQLNEPMFLSPFDISPDGTRIVYAARANDRASLYLRQLSRVDTTALPGTEGATGPFFSPDGQSIAFFADGRLKKISVAGGPAAVICDAVGTATGGSWTDDGQIVFGADFSGLRSVPASGGTPKPLTQPAIGQGEAGHVWPHALPGHRGILFSIVTEEGRWIAVLDRDSGQSRRLVKAGGEARYLSTGDLLYQESTSLMAAPFDLTRLTLAGISKPVLDIPGGSQFAGEDHTAFAVSATGTLVYRAGEHATSTSTLIWVHRSGRVSALPLPPGWYAYPRISPDGTRIATTADNAQIWICDIESGRRRRLTGGGINYAPVWSTDGTRIAFTAYRAGRVNLFWKPVDSDDAPQPLVVGGEERKYAAWWSSADGTVIYNTLNPTSGGDIWTQSAAGQRTPLLTSRFNEGKARLSPDGRWLAYVSDESGKDEVYVRQFPGPGDTTPVSSDGGMEPVWSPTGRELFYRNGSAMMAVEIGPGSRFRPEPPRRLFEGPNAAVGGGVAAMYDVSRDGQRFLMIRLAADTPTPASLQVTLNWFEELKAKAPETR